MDTRHMRHFVALAETLHFGQAAARMNMSQPPFSRQIASLEETLGVKLVERTSRKVILTPAGAHFLKDCRATLEQFDAACRDVQLVAKGMAGELRLGFMMHAAQRIIPRLVRLYSAARPEVRLTLDERTPGDIDELLIEGKLDAAVTFGGKHAPHLRSVRLATDRLRLIVPVTHALSERDDIVAANLDGENLIAAPSSVAPTLRSAIGIYCATSGIVPHFALEPRLQHTIIHLVAEGLGIALVPESLCREPIAGISSRPLVDAPEFDVVLCAPLTSRNPAVRDLFDIVADPAKGFAGAEASIGDGGSNTREKDLVL